MSSSQYHKWEATGVTGYPITHPIVGQTDFYRKFKHWLPLMDDERFAHVFAVVAPWGVGKSRLGYEIVAQIGGSSRGWKVRADDGGLEDARLFDNDADRVRYLALYIRYSQVAHRQLNLDNWFAPAVYKALSPLARGQFDSSIQHQVARQARNRLEAEGFNPGALASALELDTHPEEAIYSDTALATRLCNAAYEVLRGYGIRHVVVVLDELETAAERATGGMEAEEARAMDGKSITMLRRAVELLGRPEIEMMSKAVKEEDARARFPWLRFVALCSPAIGDELKEVQSTDRRFEIVDLARNAFSDVSTFVKSLEKEGRLLRTYPRGLVEAAYMMSGANFGWFNVIMAVVDQVLQKAPPTESSSLAWVFQRAIAIQERIGRYVLDHRALDEVNLESEARDAAVELLYGQQPSPLKTLGDKAAHSLLAARNAHGEPVVTRYHRIVWRKQDCMQILIRNRFQRLSGTSKYSAPGIPEPIDLERMLDDLATLAVRENVGELGAGFYSLLVPGALPDFLQLLDLIHPHPAVEETGRTLWMGMVNATTLPDDEATHLGPSVEMLRRLDIRLRKASIGSVLRDPDENDAFSRHQERSRVSDKERAQQVLTGTMRLLDQNWSYDPEPAGLGDDVLAIRTSKDGLIDHKGLWLHPKGLTVFAWVASDEALKVLATAVGRDHREQGRYPVVALTTDYGMPERFEKSLAPVFRKARESIVVVHVNSGEESALQSVGMPIKAWEGFRLRADGFTTRFAERLSRIRVPMDKRIREWRREVSRQGGIAWPIRPNGALKDEVLKRLVAGWRVVMLEHNGKRLGEVGTAPGLDHGAILGELEKLGLSPAAGPKGYTSEDSAKLWVGQGPDARPEVPSFLLRSVVMRLFAPPRPSITVESVKSDWFWGYTWDANRPADIFREWMAVAVDLGWAESDDPTKKKAQYVFVPREKLRSALNAAKNWLEEAYPSIVKRLSDMLGMGMIDQFFKPGSGSKYQSAQKHLKEAAQLLDELDALEANPPGEDEYEAAQDWFIKSTRLRLRSLGQVRRVFDKKAFEELQPDLEGRTLILTDDERPLWERIRQAEHFADAVQNLAKRIRKRVPSITDEMRARVTGIQSFPMALFTRPLSKIDHIVDAGLTGEDPLCTTKRVQHARPDTLAYYLKDLRVADAMKSLRALARELGTGEMPADDRTFDDVEGDIVSGFRNLVERYGRIRTALGDLNARVNTLEDALEDVPADFVCPAGTDLKDLRGRLLPIEGALDQSLEEDVEDLLTAHDEQMNLGRFGPLMREAQTRLLDTPEKSIKGLEGKVRTLENTVIAYRQELLKDATLHAHRDGLNALRRAKGLPDLPLPAMTDIESRSLGDGRIHVDGLATGWGKAGEKALAGTSVSFSNWLSVMVAVKAHTEPPLDAHQVDGLVTAGFLRRIYALGGMS